MSCLWRKCSFCWHKKVDEVVVGSWGWGRLIPAREEEEGSDPAAAQGVCPHSPHRRERLRVFCLCIEPQWEPSAGGRAHKSWQAFLLPPRGVTAVWQLLTTSCLDKLYQTPLCRGCCNDFLTRIYPGAMTRGVSNCNHTVSVSLMVFAIL